MKIAVIGSRDYMKFQEMIDFLDKLKERYGSDLEIVSGGCEGPDKVAEAWCQSRGVKITVFPADFDKGGKGAGIKRNSKIIDSADYILAFWDGESTGTLDGIIKAKKTKKPIQVLLA